MVFPNEAVFREDAYLSETNANVVGFNDRDGIILDRTIFMRPWVASLETLAS